MRTLKLLTVAVALLLLAIPAFAQTTGRIEGRVTDETGGALPGISVTITSPSQLGEKMVMTDADGRFRFPAVAPGVYDLVAQLEGFGIVENQGFTVRLDQTVTLDLRMSSAFTEEVIVSSIAPVIDITSTTTGANFNKGLIEELPSPRTFEGIAFAAPGVVDGGLGDNPSIGGASAAENRYVIDGLDTTDHAFGVQGTTVPVEFTEEIQVKTGGYEAEYGGALGGVLNVITKSGGNDLRGDLFGYWSDDSVQAQPQPTVAFGREIGFEEYDLGLAIGGKIVQDKLWYFLAANPSSEELTSVTRSETENTTQTDSDFFAAKLTFQLNPEHQIMVSGFGDPTDVTSFNDTRNAWGLLLSDREQGAQNFGVSYTGSLSANLFLELAAGLNDQEFQRHPVTENPRYDVRAQDPGGVVEGWMTELGCGGNLGDFAPRFSFAGDCLGGTFVQENGDSSREEMRGALSWFLETGNVEHDIKFGASSRKIEYVDNSRYPGPAAGAFFDANGGSDADGDGVTEIGVPIDAQGLVGQRWLLFDDFSILIEYDQDSSGTTDETAFYFQDHLRVTDHFSLNLGVRVDSSESIGDRSAASRQNTAPNSDAALDFGFGDMIAPRVGFTWDVTKNGKSKLYAHYGRFYESVPLDINARAFGNEQFNFYYFYYPEDGSLPNAANPGTHWYSYLLGAGVGVSDDIEPMYTTESLVGFEYEVMPNLAVGVKYTERDITNVIEDISVDGGITYFITNPGGTVTVNPVTGETLDEPAVFPEPVRDYRALELTLNKRFSDNWQLYASYVNSKNEGNYGGLFRQDNGQLDPNITSLYDLPSLLVGAQGLLPNDREHQVKVYGAYHWSFGLVTGFNGRFLSGNPISKLGAHPIYGAAERFVTPRGTYGTTPDIWDVDLSFQYPIDIGDNARLKLTLDLFNVTNEQKPTAVDQEWTFLRLTETVDPNECGGPGTGPGTECEDGNKLFGQATVLQAPRTIRLGVKFSF